LAKKGVEAVAEVLEISPATVKCEWQVFEYSKFQISNSKLISESGIWNLESKYESNQMGENF
jgi:hypothetical protein